MEIQDKELISQYLDGELRALEMLVERYRQPLFGLILNLVRNKDDAEDIFQETWFRAIRRMESYKPDSFMGWLAMIARNLIIDKSRTAKPMVSLDVEYDDGSTPIMKLNSREPDARRKTSAKELGKKINAAIMELPEDQREVFVMRVQAGLPFKEICGIQGTSINTALARMQYALAKLRDILKEDYKLLGEMR